MSTILQQIIQTKHQEVAARKVQTPLEALKETIQTLGRPRNFFGAVTRKGKKPLNLIAEVKKASPSAGVIRPDFDPVDIARQYAAAGADALSVLTDETYFQGKLEYLHAIRDRVKLPVLRKDFIIDPYQVYESRAAGADAILLIAECLETSQMIDLQIARGPQVVVEPANPPSVVLATRPVSTQPATTRFVTAPETPPPPETAALDSGDILFLSIAPPLLGLIPLIGLNLLLMPRGARTLGFQWPNLPRGLFLGVIGILIAMPLVLWSSSLVELLYQLFHYQTPTAHQLLLVLDHAGPMTRVLVLFAAVLIAPIFEEFLFRGHLQTLLRRRYEPRETPPLPV
jgi:hypothetical protein